MKRLNVVTVVLAAAATGFSPMASAAADPPSSAEVAQVAPKPMGPAPVTPASAIAPAPPNDLPADAEKLPPPAKPGAPLGPTQPVQIDPNTHEPVGISLQQDGDPDVTILTAAPYCSQQLIYAPVRNTNSAPRNFRLDLHIQGQVRSFYGSALPNDITYVPYYGAFGTFHFYLYLWDTPTRTYIYDEHVSGNNTCSVDISHACSDGVVTMTFENNGTSFATVLTRRIIPEPTLVYSNTPQPGGATVTRQVTIHAPDESPRQYVVRSRVANSILDEYFAVGTC